MTGNEIQEEIIALLIKEKRAMTAKQIAVELMLEDEKNRVSQALTLLKKSGTVMASSNYCDEDDAVRNFYELNQGSVSATPEAEENKPPKKVERRIIEQPKVKAAEPKPKPIEKPLKQTKTVYQIEVCGEYVTEFDTLEEAKEKAETIAITEKEPVDIIAVEIHKVGTVKPVVTTEFLAA